MSKVNDLRIHSEVLLAAAYALLLIGVAISLEWLARHSYRRSDHIRNAGFLYKDKYDVWLCPDGHHLKREEMDADRKVARYRAPAHACNACPRKADCTDSDAGRVLESHIDAWVKSETRRFHRGLSLTLLFLAVLLLTIESMRYHFTRDWLLLGIIALPVEFFGLGYFFSFLKKR